MLRTLLPLILCVSSLVAQTATSRIRGVVTDSSNALVPGAEVTALHETTGLKRTILTNPSGQYGFDAMPLGKYTITVSMKGFKLETQAQLVENTIMAFTLELPRGAKASGKGRVVWCNRETFATWAGIEILSMPWGDKRRLSHLLTPERADWERIGDLCVKLVMVLVVLTAAHRMLFSSSLRGLLGTLAPKIVALVLMGWALVGLLKRGRR